MNKENKKDEKGTMIIEDETQWESKANEVISIKLIHREEDIEKNLLSFHPNYTHQLFQEEKIKGYKGLQVNLMYTAGSLVLYLDMKYNEKRDFLFDDIINIISNKLPKDSQPLSSLDEFIKRAKEDHIKFKPSFGEHLYSYTITNESGNEVTYEIYKASISEEKARQYHSKLQLFILWFIDGSSFIDDTDTNWDLFFLFEKNNEGGDIYYTIVGYSTVYNFYAYPNQTRKRISQFLILPPFQKKGHGVQLLNRIYKSSRIKQVKDITVEEPSPEFSRLRDVVDISNLLENGFFTEKPLSEEISKDIIDKIQNQLKLSIQQIYHCHEILLFYYINVHNESQYKSYRLKVKRRLFKLYQDILSGIENKEERKKELQKYFEEIENEYKLILSSNKIYPYLHYNNNNNNGNNHYQPTHSENNNENKENENKNEK